MKKQISSILFIALLSCLVILCALSASATEDAEMWLDEKAPLDDYAYSMAIIGDTQIVSRDNPDNMANIYAESYGLIKFAGSDNHRGAERKNLAGVCFDTPLNDEKDFVFTISADKEELPASIFNFCKIL